MKEKEGRGQAHSDPVLSATFTASLSGTEPCKIHGGHRSRVLISRLIHQHHHMPVGRYHLQADYELRFSRRSEHHASGLQAMRHEISIWNACPTVIVTLLLLSLWKVCGLTDFSNTLPWQLFVLWHRIRCCSVRQTHTRSYIYINMQHADK